VDTFTYVMQDGYGLTYTGTVTIAVGVAVKKIVPKKLPDGAVELSFYGTPGAPYALERTFSLTQPDLWSPQETNVASANGSVVFTNMPVSTSNNFWRIRTAP